MARKLLVLALVLSALLVPTNASGVWGGELDTAHPQVGAMYFDYEATGAPRIDGLVCSGSFAGDSRAGPFGGYDVFLLAGHCLPPAELGIPAAALFVSFSNNASVTDTHSLVSSPIQVQSYHQMPGFGHDSGRSPRPRDPAPAEGLGSRSDRARSARARRLPRHAQEPGYAEVPRGRHRRLRQHPELGRPGPDFVHVRRHAALGDDDRHRARQGVREDAAEQRHRHGLRSLLRRLRLAADRPGDAGRVISVTTGGNGQCNSHNINYRVDTPQAREFLGQFLALP